MHSPVLRLRRGKEESLLRFHPWVFSGAIARKEPAEPAEGDLVEVRAADGTLLGRGHYASGSIAVRMLTFRDEPINASWWVQRIAAALALRRALGLVDNARTTCYRLVHGEGDGLPGLIVDRYEDATVIQCHSVGMYRERERIAAALRAVLGEGLTLLYDKSAQTLPHGSELRATDGYLIGSGPAQRTVLENGHRFEVDWESGQKTGFFLDQRENRALVQRYAAGRKVLNTFCYTGGFSVYALAGGARSVLSVDASARAVEQTLRNVELGFGAPAPHEALTADVFDWLRQSEERYDLIVLDPPAFAKHRGAVAGALQAYRRLNAQALRRLAPGGILFTFSCSQAVPREAFRSALFAAAASEGRAVRLLHQLTQPADHPIGLFHPEGEYLKGLVLSVE